MGVRRECTACHFVKRQEEHERLNFPQTIWQVGEQPGNSPLHGSLGGNSFQKDSQELPSRHKEEEGSGGRNNKTGSRRDPLFRKEPT